MSSSCVLWNKGLSHNGYGLTSVGNKTYRAHRLAYCRKHNLNHDDIRGKVVMHTCDVRNCVNPDHLVLGTHIDNMRDMKLKGRAARGLANSKGKLSESDKEFIIKNYTPHRGAFTTVKLARMFKVNNTSIGKVIKASQEQLE